LSEEIINGSVIKEERKNRKNRNLYFRKIDRVSADDNLEHSRIQHKELLDSE
jgi:hypothetical protein